VLVHATGARAAAFPGAAACSATGIRLGVVSLQQAVFCCAAPLATGASCFLQEHFMQWFLQHQEAVN
jgi:hypothetical protein